MGAPDHQKLIRLIPFDEMDREERVRAVSIYRHRVQRLMPLAADRDTTG
jgi:hypothetical protein